MIAQLGIDLNGELMEIVLWLAFSVIVAAGVWALISAVTR